MLSMAWCSLQSILTARCAGILAVMFLAIPVDAQAQQSSAIAEGARVYGDTCGSCHNGNPFYRLLNYRPC